ncbi:MAG TPA: aminotransferase class I/II-fold pyridoxal phosphate-dependent enzyme, partial [Stenomitos sp.]
IKDSYAVDAIAMRLATAAIRDQDYKNWAVVQVRRSRATLSQQLQALGFRVWPSQGNFLMVQPPAGHPALDLQQALKANGILVRHFNLPGVADKLRISIGTEDQNGVLCRHLSQLLQPSVLHQATTTDPLPVEPVDPIS